MSAPTQSDRRISAPAAVGRGSKQRALRVVFVGAFQEAAKDGAVGGSQIAARSLVSSRLAQHVHWVLVDTTSRSVPPPSLPVRALFAVSRLGAFVPAVMRSSTDATLIFASANFSFVEKGVMAMISKVAGKPVLMSPRSGAMLESLARSRLLRWFTRAVLSRCDLVVCQGETWRKFYQDLTGLPDHRLMSIPNWVSLAEFSSIRPLQLRDGPPVFLYLGWIEEYKGTLDLIHAVHRSRAELGAARVVICGRGGAMAEAQRLTETFGLQEVISFRGWVLGDQKRAVLAESDVLVLPSHLEGMPNAILEAMATGLPVIATRVGAIPDIVAEGATGLLIDAGDVAALAAALVRLAKDPVERLRMGRAAREKIARDNDIEVAWPRILAALRAVVDDGRPDVEVG